MVEDSFTTKIFVVDVNPGIQEKLGHVDKIAQRILNRFPPSHSVQTKKYAREFVRGRIPEDNTGRSQQWVPPVSIKAIDICTGLQQFPHGGFDAIFNGNVERSFPVITIPLSFNWRPGLD